MHAVVEFSLELGTHANVHAVGGTWYMHAVGLRRVQHSQTWYMHSVELVPLHATHTRHVVIFV